MTYTKLIERLRKAARHDSVFGDDVREHASEQAADAIEALHKEVSTLDVLLEECKMDWSGDVTQLKAEHKHEIQALQAENERLQSALAQCRDAFPIPAQGSPIEQEWAAAMGEPESAPDFVKASVDVMGKGEPVASIYISAMGREFDDWKCELPEGRNLLYAAPKALAPLTDEQLLENDDVLTINAHHIGDFNIVRKITRAVEAAHGIGGTP